ncbi:unnamed protein product [Candida verbasci]|uniref:Cytochrome P450 n=1 Tax=Candida verbasci TaxID=1227364 RepID=A0A9W4TZD3_9ASCO|nr:unnamed protein product [Candida verbasci]
MFNWLFILFTYHPWLCVILSIILLLGVYDLLTTPMEIEGIFTIPNELPIFGHLIQIINNPSLVFLNWCNLYNESIFQIRIGNTRYVVVNSYNDVFNLWINYSCQNNSRPIHYTFHKLVSSYQGYTIGSTPSSPTCKRKKKSIGKFMTRSSIDQYREIINENINQTIHELFKHTYDEIDLMKYFQQYILKTSIMISYGIELTDTELIDKIIYVENQIIKLRSSISCLQDTIPVLRIFPSRARSLGKRREVYMNKFMKELDLNSERGWNSIVGNLLTNESLTVEEIQSVCLTLVSAGLDNTPLNLNYLFGVISSREDIQLNALRNILETSNDNLELAWEQSQTVKCDYVYAIVLECLRNFSVLPLSLPRLTTKTINYKGLILPNGTNLLMNTYSANHDPEIFDNPYEFRPERWLKDGKLIINPASSFQNHFTFGAGSRMCSGNNLATKEIYEITIRLLLIFEIITNEEFELNPFRSNTNPKGISFEPKQHCIILKPRYLTGFEKLYELINR